MESPKEGSENFLDALPLLRSEDSDPFVVPSAEAKSKYKEKKSNVREREVIKNRESKESFELLSQTVDEQVNNKESQQGRRIEGIEVGMGESIEGACKDVYDVFGNKGLGQCEVRPSQITESDDPTVKIEYLMHDSSKFYITINPPKDEGKIEFLRPEHDSTKLFVEKDLFMAQDLKAYCPKIAKKNLPWTIFGAGIAAFIVFIIIIIKIRRGIKR